MKKDFAPCPADYENTRSVIYRIKRNYPFVNCQVCGRSVCGRAIFTLSVGCCREPVLLAAGVHGSEWLNIPILLRFFENVCESVRAKSEYMGVPFAELLRYRGIVAVPCVNPDGTEISLHGTDGACCNRELIRKSGDSARWNANIRGIDINHNFNAGWKELKEAEIQAGYTAPGPTRYGGECAESEPETRAMVSLCRRICPRQLIVLHSQGEEIFWRYGETVPERSETMAQVFSAVSGYTLVENSGLFAHGGFKDWFISELKKPAFTVETGKGQNPLPPEDICKMYPVVEKILAAACVM